jgi:branched-chain amino acid transport system ATP-binding protein
VTEEMLKVEDLSLRYPGAGDLAVNKATLSIGTRQIALVAGPNGAGKTSLVRSISGFLRGERTEITGRVRFDGTDILNAPPDRTARMGMYFIPEHDKVFANLSVRENLRIFTERTRKQTSIENAFDLFPSVRALLDRPAGLLSGGEQQMVALCGAMLSNCKLLVIDEPCQGLAPIIVEEVMRTLRVLRDETGASILIVDQNLRNTLPISDIVFEMAPGGVISATDIDELTARSRTTGYARDFAVSVPRELDPSAVAGGGPRPGEGASEKIVLSARQVGVSFRSIHAVRDVSLEIAAGETVGLAGANGAGKSSLLNCLSGVYRASTGQLTFNGTDIVGMAPEDISMLGMGRTVQHSESFRSIGARDAMLLGLHASMPKGILKYVVNVGRTRRAEVDAREQVLALADRLGVRDEVEDNRPMQNLPYGVRKRIDIGRALAREPSLLLYDEPASGLSAEEKHDLAGLIEELAQDTGRAQLVVDHDINFLSRICDRIVVMSAGEVIAMGLPGDIWKDEAVIRSYIGE